MAINTYFQNIANAIRTKTGSAGLITPAEMPQAILDIVSGGGITPKESLHTHVNNGYLGGANFYYDPNNTYNSYIFRVEPNTRYIIAVHYKNRTSSARFRISSFSAYPINFTTTVSGVYSYSLDSISEEFYAYTQSVYNTGNNPYLMIYTGADALDYEVCLIKVSNCFDV